MGNNSKLGSFQEVGRSKLIFEFYKGGAKIIRVLDFFENISVKETQKASLITYSPIGRAGSLFAYGGAKSRVLNINFNLTLPNIMNVSRSNYMNFHSKLEDQKGAFFVHRRSHPDSYDYSGIPGGIYSEGRTHSPTVAYDRDYALLAHRNDKGAYEMAKGTTIGNGKMDVLAELKEGVNTAAKSQRAVALDVVQFWINLIRASTINSSIDPTLSPPIVRLRHGAMYQDVPCVCASYNISHDEKAGYDRDTILPRVIKVSMQLHEYRPQSLDGFKHKDPTRLDNLPGWEAVVMNDIDNDKYFSMDPGILNLGDDYPETINQLDA
jgi:hypothetical protein